MRVAWLGCLLAACVPFEGYRRDAAVADVTDAPTVDVARDAAPLIDRPITVDVTAPPCGADLGDCDPVLNTGCPEGQACVIDDVFNLHAVCGTPGRGVPGAECQREADCAAGLHCLEGQCVMLCCTAPADDRCARRFGASSHCAVETYNPLVNGCTVRNQCDYLTGVGCPEGAACYPQSGVGEARCLAPGGVEVGGACQLQNECVAGATCVSGTAGVPGRCALICNPRGARCPNGRTCAPLADRPSDWGACGR